MPPGAFPELLLFELAVADTDAEADADGGADVAVVLLALLFALLIRWLASAGVVPRRWLWISKAAVLPEELVGLLPGLGLGFPFECRACDGCFLLTTVRGSEARRMVIIRLAAVVGVVGETGVAPPLRRPPVPDPIESSSWNFLTRAFTDVADLWDSPVGVLRITFGVVGASGKSVRVAATTVASSMPLELPSWIVATGFFTNVAVKVFSLSESEALRVGVTIWVGF